MDTRVADLKRAANSCGKVVALEARCKVGRRRERVVSGDQERRCSYIVRDKPCILCDAVDYTNELVSTNEVSRGPEFWYGPNMSAADKLFHMIQQLAMLDTETSCVNHDREAHDASRPA